MEDASDKLTKCQQELGITFKDPSVLTSALTHPSSHEGRNVPAHHRFERMELFGDALLNFVMTEQLLKTFPDLDEGQLSKYRSTLVSREALFNIIASNVHLHDYISVGPGEDLKSPREKAKILADVSEAVFAAIYFDQGLDAVRSFILKHFLPHLTNENIHEIAFNAKGALQEEVQKRTQRLPDYHFERRENIFYCRVSGGHLGTAEGEGASKKEAAQNAARELLDRIAAVPVPQPETPAPSQDTRESTSPKPDRPHRSRRRRPRRRRPFRRDPHKLPPREEQGRTQTPHSSPQDKPLHRTDHRRGPGRSRKTSRPPWKQKRPEERRPPRSGPPQKAVTPARRRASQPGDSVDWRTWQSSQQSGSGAEESKKKTSWRDRLRKLTGRKKQGG